MTEARRLAAGVGGGGSGGGVEGGSLGVIRDAQLLDSVLTGFWRTRGLPGPAVVSTPPRAASGALCPQRPRGTRATLVMLRRGGTSRRSNSGVCCKLRPQPRLLCCSSTGTGGRTALADGDCN
jgi:hypothetical protein